MIAWLKGWRPCPVTSDDGKKKCPYYRRRKQKYCAIHLRIYSIDLKNAFPDWKSEDDE